MMMMMMTSSRMLMNTDNVPSPEIVAVESQPLFSSAEPDAANSAVGTPP